jgi:hypothetical protein
MFAEINAAVQATKALFEVVKANKGLTEYNELVSAVSEVSTKLMSATAVALASQEKQAALSDRVRDLEKKLVELENWKSEAERYQLSELATDVFVFTLKPGMENSEPSHKLCTACYSKGQKGYLQRADFDSQGTHYKCDRCNLEIINHSQKREFERQKRPDPKAFY